MAAVMYLCCRIHLDAVAHNRCTAGMGFWMRGGGGLGRLGFGNHADDGQLSRRTVTT